MIQWGRAWKRARALLHTAVSHFPEKGVMLMGRRRWTRVLRGLLRLAMIILIMLTLSQKVC